MNSDGSQTWEQRKDLLPKDFFDGCLKEGKGVFEKVGYGQKEAGRGGSDGGWTLMMGFNREFRWLQNFESIATIRSRR